MLQPLSKPSKFNPSIYFQLTALFAVLTLLVGGHYVFRGLHRIPVEPALQTPAANAERGPMLIRFYGCSACHIVPGVPTATGTVGPPLDRVSQNNYIAGVLAYSPQNLARWIMDPKDVDPQTAMPDLDVTLQDARDIAAYLHRRRG